MSTRGFFAVGIYHPKRDINVGGLWRAATLYGAAYVFTVGARYNRQATDTPKTPLHTPLHHYADMDDLMQHLPWSCPLVGVELDARASRLTDYKHPQRAVYLLGAEDHGLPQQVMDQCHDLVVIPTARTFSHNVASAGSIVLHDRHVKAELAVAS
ncbi:TrmH family RNA methyltransferase [Streptomyces sp. DW26H14]|uniref:TrmH family RNA methyltransferase n=1 Tax=Streptomyces sp. DW26H14 TaxID=3435395 RepID=UPI00403E18EE